MMKLHNTIPHALSPIDIFSRLLKYVRGVRGARYDTRSKLKAAARRGVKLNNIEIKLSLSFLLKRKNIYISTKLLLTYFIFHMFARHENSMIQIMAHQL